jgi:ATP-dependent RNA helicase RhlE
MKSSRIESSVCLQLMLKEEQGSFLVFARTKQGRQAGKKLVSGSVKATRIHGDRSQAQRNQALQGFQQGHYRVMVATDVAARHSRRRNRARGQLRSAAGPGGLHPPRRQNRTRRGARIASTFGTRSERGEIRNIERKLNIQLTRHLVSSDIPQDEARVSILRK